MAQSIDSSTTLIVLGALALVLTGLFYISMQRDMGKMAGELMKILGPYEMGRVTRNFFILPSKLNWHTTLLGLSVGFGLILIGYFAR